MYIKIYTIDFFSVRSMQLAMPHFCRWPQPKRWQGHENVFSLNAWECVYIYARAWLWTRACVFDLIHFHYQRRCRSHGWDNWVYAVVTCHTRRAYLFVTSLCLNESPLRAGPCSILYIAHALLQLKEDVVTNELSCNYDRCLDEVGSKNSTVCPATTSSDRDLRLCWLNNTPSRQMHHTCVVEC